MTEISKEERMKLAIEAFNKGQFQSKTACAQAFDVPSRTLMKRLNGVTSREESIANGRKLSDTEEMTLSRWILDMYERGLPLQISNVRHLAQLLLSARLKSQRVLCLCFSYLSGVFVAMCECHVAQCSKLEEDTSCSMLMDYKGFKGLLKSCRAAQCGVMARPLYSTFTLSLYAS